MLLVLVILLEYLREGGSRFFVELVIGATGHHSLFPSRGLRLLVVPEDA
jgi:hypothetical protein